MRAAIFGVLVVGVMVYAPTQNARLVRPAESSQPCPQPGAIDLVFIIDRSGSFDVHLLGQSYNVQIDGVLRALRDRSVIPRDGSVAVAVETFAGSGTIQVPFKQIDTAADAEAIAAMVESLRCTTVNCTPTGLCPVFGSNPASNYAPAITTATDHLNYRPGARHALLLSSDGQPSDLKFAVSTAQRVGGDATDHGVKFELDLILLAQPAPSCDDSGAEINQIVFPQPACELPGAVLAIGTGACNKPCASLDDSAVKADCDRQVKEFAELTRRVIRSQPAMRLLTVNTDADTAPATPVGSTLSLRQAIEIANSNCGATTITFAPALKDTTISPSVPLPALTEPDIRICGCDEMNCGDLSDTEKKCDPFLTIDGSKTDTTKGEQHSDGILIRSNYDVVRGLRIIHFKGAGVGIEPGILIRVNHDVVRGLRIIHSNGAGVGIEQVLPSDNVGFNLITRNVFENNVKAGVRVIDRLSDPAFPGSEIQVPNNGNTISMNDILGSETPIDLGGDGPTPNDPGDPDVGPNTLLNFPDNLSVIALTADVSATASGVLFTGQVNGPTAAGATVEIFAITRFRPAPGGRVIDGVTFLTHTTTNANGSFAVTGPDDSPTCGYTATVTDTAGNTSELMFPCAGFAVAKATALAFGTPAAQPNGGLRTGVFSIENTGCSPLFVSFDSLTRNAFPNRFVDDLAHFDVGVVGPNAPGVVIQPGQTRSFTATFNPAIPIVLTRDKKVPAAQVLAAKTESTLNLAHNGCTKKSDQSVMITGLVDGSVKLIDPKSPRASPLVTLSRSGDELTVSFSVFDSDLDVNYVNYEFFKVRNNQCTDESVPAEVSDHDLGKAISGRRPLLITGQSFTVIQPFSGAKKNPEAGCVRVTVSDPRTSASATSAPSIGSLASASVVSTQFSRQQGGTIVRPPLKLPSKLKESRAAGKLRTGDEKEKR